MKNTKRIANAVYDRRLPAETQVQEESKQSILHPCAGGCGVLVAGSELCPRCEGNSDIDPYPDADVPQDYHEGMLRGAFIDGLIAAAIYSVLYMIVRCVLCVMRS